MTAADLLLSLLFSALLASLLRTYVLHSRVLYRLRDEHPKTWAELGYPGLSFSRKARGPIRRFLDERAYLDLNDPELTELCEKRRATVRAAMIFLGLTIAVTTLHAWVTATRGLAASALHK